MENWNGRRVLIVGMARSGICAAKMLCDLGADVTVSDTTPIPVFHFLSLLRQIAFFTHYPNEFPLRILPS